jgi:ABC-2 type transport system ATP-binding protein
MPGSAEGAHDPVMNSLVGRLAATCYRRRRTVLVIRLTAVVVLSGVMGAVGSDYRDDFTLPGVESKRGSDILDAEFGGQGAGQVGDIVFQTQRGVADPEVREAMEAFLSDVAEIHGVVAVTSRYEPRQRVADLSARRRRALHTHSPLGCSPVSPVDQLGLADPRRPVAPQPPPRPAIAEVTAVSSAASSSCRSSSSRCSPGTVTPQSSRCARKSLRSPPRCPLRGIGARSTHDLRRPAFQCPADRASDRARGGCGTQARWRRRPPWRVRSPSRPATDSITTPPRSNLMTPIIEAHDLSKRFGKIRALDNLELVAQPGGVTALLGPNGAGKTTFISAVATLLRADSGELRVAGFDAATEPRRVRQVIGLAGQSASVEPAMTGTENLELVARLFGLDRRASRTAAAEILERLGLTDARDRLVRTYSGGMRRRLDLGASLVGRPRLLLLDEPTTGLDPRSRMELWDAIRSLVADGTDILLTTQYLEEADHLARDVVIVDHGRVIAAGTPDELKDRAGRDVIEVRPRAAGDLVAVEQVLAAVAAETAHSDMDTQRVSAAIDGGAEQLAVVVRLLDEQRVALDDIGLRRPTLDEVFLALTSQFPAPTNPDTEPAADAA